MTPTTPTEAAPTKYPIWAREPARIVGWIVTVALVVASAAAELLNEVVDLLPDSWRATVRTVALTVATVGLIAARIQTWLTRNGLGPTGNGKDGVWSPATVTTTLEETARAVAAAKAAAPEDHAR